MDFNAKSREWIRPGNDLPFGGERRVGAVRMPDTGRLLLRVTTVIELVRVLES
jgi:hypothetical protein